jgi:mannosyl-oligosaccharide alpha-1,2-mannosidase
MMLGGLAKAYRTMYEKFVEVAKQNLFFRPMTIGNKDILLSGTLNQRLNGPPRFSPSMEHLTCFVGGMLAIAGRIFSRPDDFEDGRKLADGCVWAYKNTITGIMPESFRAVPCASRMNCTWDEKKWYNDIDAISDAETVRERINAQQLSPGFTMVNDKRYLLRYVSPASTCYLLTLVRPEAIESVFILWRITGDQYWADSGWDMFTAIKAHTTTDLAHSAIDNVMSPAPKRVNEMESFWLAETLKYFYLLYSETSVVSLDEYVL